jgi:GWxTD domain-containing protein
MTQDIPFTSEGEIKFYCDAASFKGEGEKTYQEFYLMLFADQLAAKEHMEEFKVKASLRDKFGKTVSFKEWTSVSKIPSDVSNMNSYAIYDQWSENLLPGEYEMHIEINDVNSKRSGKLQGTITVKNLNSAELSLSGLEFVSSYSVAEGQSHFTKGSKNIKPNPWRRYGALNPVLYFYYEIYNLPPDADSVRIKYQVVNLDGSIVKTFPEAGIKTAGGSSSVLHGLNAANMKTGIYYLAVTAVASDKEVKLSRRFEIIQPDYLTISKEANEQVEAAGNILVYEATPSELKFYEGLSEQAKINYLTAFWKKRDDSPGTPENEYLMNLIARYNYANENFGWGKTAGWKTDRGRVIIKYGMPEEIERHYFEQAILPYEEWIYSKEKEFEFIFSDLRSDGRFVLVHSTLEGEVSNPYWKQQSKR